MSVLTIIATPIGCLKDMSPSMVEALTGCDVLLCESLSSAKKLYQHIGCAAPTMHRYWQRNESDVVTRIEQYRDKAIGLISDAGVPAISDPGYALVRAYHEKGWKVNVVPGPCAGITALSICGLTSDRFCFSGFLPAKSSARSIQLEQLRNQGMSVVLYESPRRVLGLLEDIVEVYGADHMVFVVKEMTKIHQMYARGPVLDVLKDLQSWQLKGEFVVIIERAKVDPEWQNHAVILSQYMSHHDTAECVAKLYDVSRSVAYRFLLNKI